MVRPICLRRSRGRRRSHARALVRARLANVRDAVAKADVRFPVAFDPEYQTWNAFKNQYWPAFYFIDRAGSIRHVAAGEGGYDASEQVIRELLAGA